MKAINIKRPARPKYWTIQEFTEEFYKLERVTAQILPMVFSSQIDKVGIIVEHWQTCHPCELGFNISEYSGTFEEVFLILASTPFNHHTCDGDYKLGNLIFNARIGKE